MHDLPTAEEMREIERSAMESGTVTGLDLMERAGRGAVDAILAAWPGQPRGEAAVLCGPGNNGGDGFVVARLLHARGWRVRVGLWGAADEVGGDARTNLERWRALGEVASLAEVADRPADLVVDALFGTGLSRPIPEAAARAWHALAGQGARSVALDCPSGFDADTGRWRATAGQEGLYRLLPDLCVAFHAPKLGQHLAPCAVRAPVSVDIGLGHAPRTAAHAIAPGADRAGWLADGSAPGGTAHKYDRGHALVLSGGPGRGGAARMAARAALRAGAGLVTLACPPAALPENAARLDAVMLAEMSGAAALERLLSDARLSCLCLGPGLGLGKNTRDLVATALSAGRRTVLDADALTAFEEDPDTLFARLRPDCVLTPHEGEFARLFPDLGQGARTVSKADAARQAAARAGAVVLLKGAATVVATPDGAVGVHAAFHDRAVPQLATAGAGDVLAGIVAGRLAAGGAGIAAAAERAVWLHAEAARRFGPGLIAEDLPDLLPGVLSTP